MSDPYSLAAMSYVSASHRISDTNLSDKGVCSASQIKIPVLANYATSSNKQ